MNRKAALRMEEPAAGTKPGGPPERASLIWQAFCSSLVVPEKNSDLHGNVPESAPVVLLLVDVINDLEFEGSDAIVAEVTEFAERVAALKKSAKGLGIPVIYANDNFGRWQSNFNQVVEHCLTDGVKGEPLARILKPQEDDYFVLKPKHSAFYATTLDTLLRYLDAKTLIIAGIAGNICILFTANDAYMRDYSLVVPADCVISNSEEENATALEQMRSVLKADITRSSALDFRSLMRDRR